MSDDLADRVKELEERVAALEAGTPTPKAASSAFNAMIRAEVRRQKGLTSKPGRRGWTGELFRQRLAEAEAATSPPLTVPRINANFVRLDGRIGYEDPDTLRKLRAKHLGK